MNYLCIINTAVVCTGAQDIYFVVDGTLSNSVFTFCQEMFAVELISAALKPRTGSDLTGTRIGAYLFPESKESNKDDMRLLKIGGKDCKNTVQRFHQLNQAVTYTSNRLSGETATLRKALATETLPARVLNFLAKEIREDVNKDPNHRRIVIILTDGSSDNTLSEVTKAVDSLVVTGGSSLTLIAAGVSSTFSNDLQVKDFRKLVELLANNTKSNTFVTERDSKQHGIDLGLGLVDIMERNGAICTKPGNNNNML